jgi:hypothetical protein
VAISVTNNAGNVTTATQTIKIDTAAPSVTASYSGTAGSNGWFVSTGSDTLSASAVSGVANVTYSLDGGATQSYSLPFAVTGDGTHTVAISVTNNAGNVTTATQTIKIDTAAPSVSASYNGTAGSNAWFVGTGNDTLSASAVSGVASVTYSLDGGARTAYTTPFAVTGDGTHTVAISVTNNAGNVTTATQTIKLDTAAPSVSESYNGTAGSNGWFTSTGSDTLSASDATSAVASITYQLDGGAATAYSGPIAVSGDGTHTVAVSVTDNAGNVTTATQTIKIDTAAPSVSESYNGTPGSNGWFTGTGSDTLSASDAISGVASVTYQLDGGASMPYTTPFAVTGDGTHTVAISVTNNAGNVTTATQTIKIDTAAPSVSASYNGTAGSNGWFTSTGNDTLSASAVSGVASVTYSLDGGATQSYSLPFAVTGDGTHTVAVSVTNIAGTVTTATQTIKIDTAAASVSESYNGTAGSNGWFVSAGSDTLSAGDAISDVASVTYQLDGGASTPYTTPFAVNGDGTHTVAISVTNNAGNVTTTAQTIKIDTAAPSVSALYSGTAGNNGWFTSTGSDTLSASDATSGVANVTYSPDGGPLTAYIVPFAVSGDGTHTVAVTATDAAGNSATQSFTLKLDTTAPSVSASFSGTAGSNGWYTSAGSLAVSGSDATSGLASITYAVDGHPSTGYSAPFTLSGDGVHTVVVTATDNAGNAKSQTFTIKIDTRMPVLSESYSGTAGSSGWFTSIGNDTLSASAVSGVASVTYSLDGGATHSYSLPFAVTGDGTHTVAISVTNNAGTVTTATQTIKIDTAAPSVSESYNGTAGTNGWFTSTGSDTLNASDAISGVASVTYQLDGGASTPYTTPFTVTGDGTHTMAISVTNNAGNVTTASQTIKIDTAAPSVSESYNGTAGSNGWYTSAGNDTLSAGDPTSGVAGLTYSLDGGAAQPYTAPFAVSGDGTHTVVVTATDNAGNSATATQTIKIDTTAPSVSVAYGGTVGNGWFITVGNVTASAGDATSGVAGLSYSLDGGAATAYTGPFAVSGDGTHTVVVTATDNAGNSTAQRLTFKLDTTAPSVSATYSGTQGSNGWYTSAGSLTLGASDTTSGVAGLTYSLDGGAAQSYTAPFAVSGDGTHTVVVTATDNAGNSATQTFTLKIDISRPALAESYSGSPAGNGWYISAGLDTLTASDSTSGVASVSYRLDGGPATAYARPFVVSGDGTHTVVVTATDNAGNVSTATQTFTVETIRPAVSVTFGPAGEVVEMVFSDGSLYQFDAGGAHYLGAGVRAASVAFYGGSEVLLVTYQNGALYQFDAAGAHLLASGGYLSASLAFTPYGAVYELVDVNGNLTQYDVFGAHYAGGGFRSASVAFVGGSEVLDALSSNGTLTQYDAAGAHTYGGTVLLSVGVASDPAGVEVLDVIFQNKMLYQFDSAGARYLGTVP